MKNIIIITGGAGFVGSNLIKLFINKTSKYEILSLDNYSTGTKQNHIKNPRVKYLKADTVNISKILNKKRNRIHSLFHFGEFARIYQSFKNFDQCFMSNSVGSKEVFKFCLDNKIKLIYSATSASLGKKGKGFLPVVSNCPKDHHSLLQLYLDGPKDKFYHIFSYQHDDKIILNSRKIFKLSHLHGKNIKKIKYAQKEALIRVFQKNKIPFREFKIKKITEETLGELFAYFILETIIIGKLSGLNPFDQPAVEQVKIFTKKLLK